jgi:hypothetical protein
MSESTIAAEPVAQRAASAPTISRRSALWLALAGGASVLFYLLVYVGGLSGGTLQWVSDIGQVLVVGASAAMTLMAARRLGLTCPLGRQWLLIGSGLVLLTLSEALWAYYELLLHQPVPSPGMADVFRLGFYVLAGSGIIAAATAYRKMLEMRTEVLASLVLSTFLLVVLYVYLGLGVLQNESLSVLERVVALAYPIGDVMLFIGPTCLMLLVARKLRFRRLAWPWIAVGVGALVFALADVGFLLMQSNGAYASGNPIDMGWMLGPVLMAAGASIALDVNFG